MAEKRTEGFIKGAMILMIANILVKVIGAVFRIPLTRAVGDYSMGLYSASYKYYTILLTIATAGIPLAISKMISESRALGRVQESKRIFRIAFLFCIALGGFGTLFMIVFANPLAALANNHEVATSVLALAPAVLLISIAAGLRGFFQGQNNMLPTGLSQVLEALSRLFVGLFLALLFIKLSYEPKYIAAGAITGVTIGTGLSALLLTVLYFISKKRRDAHDAELSESGECRTGKQILKALLALAIPVTLAALVVNLTNAIDLVLVTNRLGVLGYDTIKITSLFGIYDNYAIPLFNLVPSVIISLNVSITPVVAAAYARRDFETLHGTLMSAIRLVVIISLPAAVGIGVLANPILSLLFGAGASADTAAPVLVILSVASVFLCVASLTSTALQALGKPLVPVGTMVLGAVVKIVANYVLIAIPGIELKGAAIGTVLCYVLIAILNLAYLARQIQFKPNLILTYGKPLLASIVMGVLCFGAYRLIPGVIGLVLAVGVGGVTYVVTLVLSGGVTPEDVRILPKGEKLAALLARRKK